MHVKKVCPRLRELGQRQPGRGITKSQNLVSTFFDIALEPGRIRTDGYHPKQKEGRRKRVYAFFGPLIVWHD